MDGDSCSMFLEKNSSAADLRAVEWLPASVPNCLQAALFHALPHVTHGSESSPRLVRVAHR
jgi:hypothetical protein